MSRTEYFSFHGSKSSSYFWISAVFFTGGKFCILGHLQVVLKLSFELRQPFINDFLDFTWHCSTAAAGLVTLDFIFNTAFYTVKWVFSPQLHFPHSSIFLTAEGNRTCKFDQILWPMLSSTKISCLTGVLNPGLLSVKPRLYHWAKLPLLKMRGKTVKYILHKYILGYFGNQQKATDQINSRLNKQQKTTDFKKQQISKTTDFKNSRFQKTDSKTTVKKATD